MGEQLSTNSSFFRPGSHEAVGAVDEELLVGFNHLRRFDRVETSDFRAARMFVGIFLMEESEPVDRHLRHVVQVSINACNLVFHACNELIGLVLVEFQDAGHLDVHQSEDVVLRHFAHKLRIVWRQSLVDVLASGIHVWRLFEALVLIDAFLDEDAFQRGKMQARRVRRGG